MNQRTCLAKGQLVNHQHWLPTHPAEYNPNGSILPAVGCNRLWCEECGLWVRVIQGVELRPRTQTDLHVLYQTDAPMDNPDVAPSALSNLYLCRCHAHNEHATRLIDDDDYLHPFTPPWHCVGHPAMTFPGELDGVHLSLDDPLDSLVADLLAARAPLNIHPSHSTLAGFQAVRVYRLLDGAEARGRWASTVARHLLADDLEIRRGVLGFYRLEPAAAGVEELLRLRYKRKIWDQPDPVDPRVTLRWTLKLALDAICREK